MPVCFDPSWRMALIDAHGPDAIWLVTEAEQLVADQPDGERILTELSSFISGSGRAATELRSLHADPMALEYLIRLAEHSRWGMEIARRRPRTWWDIFQERSFRHVLGRAHMRATLQRHLAKFDDASHRINAVVRFFQHHHLRVILGDLAGSMGFEAVTGELSDIADVVVQACLELAEAQVTASFGRPSCGLSVLALGKLGGRELNYSSDIDLIFVYDHPGRSAGKRDIDHHDWFRRLGTALIGLLDGHHPEGRLYRVDMRLRPEGASGELVLTREQMVDYYWTKGRPWERQALIKARSIAGDLALGESLLEELRSWIFPTDHHVEDLDETRIMRQRIEERSQGSDVKAGVGGIRDIEFLVQYYQLGFGGRIPELRLRATLPALRVLQRHALLSREDAAELELHYVWLRMVEHRLQMFEARQLHDLPSDTEIRLLLARRCGYGGPDGLASFDLYHERVRARVRAIAERHYLRTTRDEDLFFTLVASDGKPSPQVFARLGEYGLRDGRQAAIHLRRMATEPFFVLSRGRTQRNLVTLLPMLLPLVRSSPDPDQTLEHLERIIAAVGGRSAYFQQLAANERARRVMVNLAGWAGHAIALLTEHTGLPDEIIESLYIEDERGASDLQTEARNLVRNITDPVPPLAGLRAREIVLAAIRDLDGAAHDETCRRLSRLACAVLDALLQHTVSTRSTAWGRPLRSDGQPARLAVLGLGKLGSQEMCYASDLDIILVADCQGSSEGGRELGEFWLRVVRQVLSTVIDRRLYPVDARLRPWGEQGPLVVSPEQLAGYWHEPRDLWERMAMLRVAAVAGDAVLGAEAVDLIRRRAIGPALPADWVTQVRDMRRRLEESVQGRDHLKRGWGGYVDIEFLVFARCLGRDPAELPPGGSVDDLLQRLGELGALPGEAVRECRRSLLLLRRIEGRMRLMEGRAISSIPIEDLPRQRFARCAGYVGREDLDLDLHLARERARYWFDELLC